MTPCPLSLKFRPFDYAPIFSFQAVGNILNADFLQYFFGGLTSGAIYAPIAPWGSAWSTIPWASSPLCRSISFPWAV